MSTPSISALPGGLPIEVWRHIMTFVPDTELSTLLPAVSWPFRSLAHDRLLWRYLITIKNPSLLQASLSKPQRSSRLELIQRGIMLGIPVRRVIMGSYTSIAFPGTSGPHTISMSLRKLNLERELRRCIPLWQDKLQQGALLSPRLHRTRQALVIAFRRDDLAQRLRRRKRLGEVMTKSGHLVMEAHILCPSVRHQIEWWEGIIATGAAAVDSTMLPRILEE